MFLERFTLLSVLKPQQEERRNLSKERGTLFWDRCHQNRYPHWKISAHTMFQCPVSTVKVWFSLYPMSPWQPSPGNLPMSLRKDFPSLWKDFSCLLSFSFLLWLQDRKQGKSWVCITYLVLMANLTCTPIFSKIQSAACLFHLTPCMTLTPPMRFSLPVTQGDELIWHRTGVTKWGTAVWVTVLSGRRLHYLAAWSLLLLLPLLLLKLTEVGRRQWIPLLYMYLPACCHCCC